MLCALFVIMNLRICITFSKNALTPKGSGLISNHTGTIYRISQSIFPYKTFYLQLYQHNALYRDIELIHSNWKMIFVGLQKQGLQSKLVIKYETEKNINNKTFEKKWVLSPI